MQGNDIGYLFSIRVHFKRVNIDAISERILKLKEKFCNEQEKKILKIRIRIDK